MKRGPRGRPKSLQVAARRRRVVLMRLSGLSAREIGWRLGVPTYTINNDLTATGSTIWGGEMHGRFIYDPSHRDLGLTEAELIACGAERHTGSWYDCWAQREAERYAATGLRGARRGAVVAATAGVAR